MLLNVKLQPPCFVQLVGVFSCRKLGEQGNAGVHTHYQNIVGTFQHRGNCNFNRAARQQNRVVEIISREKNWNISVEENLQSRSLTSIYEIYSPVTVADANSYANLLRSLIIPSEPHPGQPGAPTGQNHNRWIRSLKAQIKTFSFVALEHSTGKSPDSCWTGVCVDLLTSDLCCQFVT